MTRLRISLLSFVVSFAACYPSIPEGSLRCADDSECPRSFVCRADARCWRTPADDVVDSGHEGGLDAAHEDGGDAGEDADLDAGGDAQVDADLDVDAFVPPPEDCDNGIDDDLDSFVDCADTADCAERTCVPTAPSGWQGPYAAFDGLSDAAPSCGGATPSEILTGFRNPSAAPVQCSACGTTPPPLNQIGCCSNTSVTRYGSAGCTGTNLGTTSLSPDGQATCTNVLAGAASARFQLSICPASGSFNGGVQCSVTTQAVATMRPPATWENLGRLCGAPASAAAGCAPSAVCLPRPPAGFSSKMCVWHDGNVPCEGTSFTARRVYYDDVVDTRTCSSCVAGNVSGTLTCTPSILACTDACCETGSSTTFSTPSTGSICASPTNGYVDLGWARTSTTSIANATCGASSGGAPTGGVTADNATATTVCCLP